MNIEARVSWALSAEFAREMATKDMSETNQSLETGSQKLDQQQTPRFRKAYQDCLGDTGGITRLEPLYRLCESLELELAEVRKVCGDRYPDARMLSVVHELRRENQKLRERHDAITKMVERFLIPHRTSLAKCWLEAFVECGAVTINWDYPYGEVQQVKAAQQLCPTTTSLSCCWRHDGACDKFDTQCGQSFFFTTSGIKENAFKFCPFCGRAISEQTNLPTETTPEEQ